MSSESTTLPLNPTTYRPPLDYRIVAIAILGLAGIVMAFYNGQVAAVLLTILLFVIGIVWARQVGRQSQWAAGLADCQRIFVGAYTIRIIFAVLIFVILMAWRGEPYLGGGDDKTLYSWGIDAPNFMIRYGFDRGSLFANLIRPGRELYLFIVYAVTVFGRFFGSESEWLPIILNCFVGALIPVYVYRIGERTQTYISTRTAVWLTILAPDLILYSSVVLRDMLILLGITMAIYHFIEYGSGNIKLSGLITFALLIFWFLVGLRRQTAPMVLVITGITWLVWKRKQLQSFMGILKGFQVAILIGAVIITTILIFSVADVGYIIDLATPSTNNLELARAQTGSDSLGKILLDLPIVIRIPAFVVYNLLIPFPPGLGFFTNTPTGFFEAIGAIYWYILLPFYIIGMLHSFRYRDTNQFPIYLVGLIIIIGLALGATATVRLRIMAVPFLYLVAGTGWQIVRPYRQIWGLWWLGLLGAVIPAYVMLKSDIKSIMPATLIFALLALGAVKVVWEYSQPLRQKTLPDK